VRKESSPSRHPKTTKASFKKKFTRGKKKDFKCDDLGAMLFMITFLMQISPIFGEKWAFFSKRQCYILSNFL
jgi:hypothetical protein